jgi:hypothetical protein
MKTKLLFVMFLFCSFCTLNSQIYTPAGTISGVSVNNNVGIGLNNPIGLLHLKGGESWSSYNFGASLIVDGVKHNSIAFLDYKSSNPYAITNKEGSLCFSIMPALGDITTKPITPMVIDKSGILNVGAASVGTVSIEGGAQWSLYNFGAGLIIKGSRNNSIGLFDSQSLYPVAITNSGGDLIFSSMPPLDELTTKPISLMSIKRNGNVAIYGKLEAAEIKVTTTPTADFVFENDYDLEPLCEVEEFVKTNKHLKGIQSADEMNNDGLLIAEFQIQLLQKIEEMTLYLIDQDKKLKEQNIELNKLKMELDKLKLSSKQ